VKCIMTLNNFGIKNSHLTFDLNLDIFSTTQTSTWKFVWCKKPSTYNVFLVLNIRKNNVNKAMFCNQMPCHLMTKPWHLWIVLATSWMRNYVLVTKWFWVFSTCICLTIGPIGVKSFSISISSYKNMFLWWVNCPIIIFEDFV